MSMLNFYINRAGGNLPEARRRILTRVKDELRKAFDREAGVGLPVIASDRTAITGSRAGGGLSGTARSPSGTLHCDCLCPAASKIISAISFG